MPGRIEAEVERMGNGDSGGCWEMRRGKLM